MRLPKIALLSFAMLASLMLVSHARAADSGLKIAVANTQRIFNDMKETKDLKEKLEARHKDLSGQEADKRNAIQKMQQDIANLKPDSPQFQRSLAALDLEMANFEAWEKMIRIQAEREQKSNMKMLFERIQAAIGDVAKEQALDLVISDQGTELPNVDAVNMDQLRAIINQRAVLFSTKKADISEAVLTLLDQRYAKQKPEK